MQPKGRNRGRRETAAGEPGQPKKTRDAGSDERKQAGRPREGVQNQTRKPGEVAPGVSGDADQMRLNRYIARAGVASRRKADELITAGRVRINGDVVTELGTRVQESDVVEVGGRTISPRGSEYILLNKPTDTISTKEDEKDRRTVMDLVNVPDEFKSSLFPVGRLDRDTVGVLLLTNDGELAHRLMHPSYEVSKIYRVRTRAPIKPHELDRLRQGVELEDGPAHADEVAYIALPDYHEIGIKLHEGRNRQVRRMLEVLGHEITQLERVNYAGLTSDGVRRGHWRRLTPQEVRRLRKSVKLR